MIRSASVVMVLDIGTSSSRASLVDSRGALLATASRVRSLAPRPDGRTELDAARIWHDLAAATREMVAHASQRSWEIVAVSATTIRGALVLLDAAGDPLWACGSIDGRAAKEVAELKPVEPAFHVSTGQQLAFATVPRLRWFARERPDAWGRARAVLSLDAFLLHRLSGELAAPVTSLAPAGMTLLSDPMRLDVGDEPWQADQDILALVPHPIATGASVGRVNAAGSRDTALPEGLPVAAGGGDVQLATLGLGSATPGSVSVIMGSHWQTVVTTGRPRRDSQARFRIMPGPLPQTWQADAIAVAVGLQLDESAAGPGGDPDHGRLSAAAIRLGVGSGGVVAVGATPIGERRRIDAAPRIIGHPVGGTLDEAAAKWRAIVESGALVIARNLNILEAPERGIAPIRVGGGAARSNLVCHILASCIGRPVERGDEYQASVLGGAVCAGVAAGWYSDLAEGSQAIGRMTQRFEPSQADRAAYRALDARWWAVLSAERESNRSDVPQPIIELPPRSH